MSEEVLDLTASAWVTIPEAEFRQRRIDHVHRRYLDTLKTLARSGGWPYLSSSSTSPVSRSTWPVPCQTDRGGGDYRRRPLEHSDGPYRDMPKKSRIL
jgi:hypothetical protein